MSERLPVYIAAVRGRAAAIILKLYNRQDTTVSM